LTLATAPYAEQLKGWPQAGPHILAHFDEDTIIVYQAYRPSIGRFAVENQCFGGDFKYSRMSWIKPNFLWMMYRSQWGQAEGQEVVLAIRLRRRFFDSLLAQAVPSSFDARAFAGREEWAAAVARSDVRRQWDPDHLPTGEKCERRAIQLGLRGARSLRQTRDRPDPRHERLCRRTAAERAGVEDRQTADAQRAGLRSCRSERRKHGGFSAVTDPV
jgi:hypothetical protein